MAIGEGSAVSLRYKFYSSGTMTAGTEADTSTDPGASDAQLVRYTQTNLNLAVNNPTSQEISPSRQLRSSRRTSRHVAGTITGELSPGTYFDFFEAVTRGTRTSAGGNRLVRAVPTSWPLGP